MPHKRAKRSVRDRNRSESGANLAPGARRAIEDEGIPKSVARVLDAAKVQQAWAERKRKGLDDGGQGEGPSRKRLRTETTEHGNEGTKKGKGTGTGTGTGKAGLRIMPGESMAHFNRRVEDSMRHSVREAMQTSAARVRQAKREELSLKDGRKAAAGVDASSKTRGKVGAREDSDSDSDSDSEDGRGRPAAARERLKAAEPREFEKLDTSAPKRLNDVVEAPPELKKLPRKAKKLAAMGGSAKGSGASSLKEGVLSMAQKAMMEEERERAIRLYREMKKGKTTV